MSIFTYNPLRLQQALNILRSSSGSLLQTSIYKTQMNYTIY